MKHIVQSSRQGILVCGSLNVPFANEHFVSVITKADGSCALHATWGYPSYTCKNQMLSLPQGQSQGRKQCSDLLDDSLNIMRLRLGESIFFIDVLTSLWNELTVPAIIEQNCSPEGKIFWQMLCEKKPALAQRAKLTVEKEKKKENCLDNFNEEAWSVYKDCIQHKDYFFSTSELLMFANLTGVNLVVSTYTDGVFQVAGCSVDDKLLHNPVYVSINIDNNNNFRGHYERIWPLLSQCKE